METIKSFGAFCALLLLFACGSDAGEYDAAGVFEATEVIVSAEANGKIGELNLQEGDAVSPQLSLGVIDTIQLSLKKQQLLASTTAVSSRRMNVARQVAATQEQIAKLKKEKARYENLVQLQAANQKQVDDLTAELLIAERQLAAQQESLQNSNSSVSGESASLEWQIAQLEDQIRKAVIISPINGVVLAKYAEEGELATVGIALFKVADIQHLYLRAYITAGQLTELKVGQSVRVFGDAGEKGRREYAGTITWISDKSEFTPKTIQTRDERANLVYAVKVAVVNDGYLKQGMYGEIKWQ